MDNQEKSKLNFNFWFLAIVVILVLIAGIFNISAAAKINLFLGRKLAEEKEAQRPANLDIVIFKDSSCQICFDIKPFVEMIRKENVKINSEREVEVASAEGAESIQKLNIDKAPTLVASGEIEKNASLKDLWQKFGEIKDNSFVLRNIGAPYISTRSGDIRGKMKLVEITDIKCEKCYDITQHEAILKNFGLYLEDTKILDISLKKAKELVSKYKIKLLPTIILTGDIEAYPGIKAIWSQVGTIEKDGTYVFREGVKQMGTYKDLTSGKIIVAAPPVQRDK